MQLLSTSTAVRLRICECVSNGDDGGTAVGIFPWLSALDVPMIPGASMVNVVHSFSSVSPGGSSRVWLMVFMSTCPPDILHCANLNRYKILLKVYIPMWIYQILYPTLSNVNLSNTLPYSRRSFTSNKNWEWFDPKRREKLIKISLWVDRHDILN